MTKIGQFVMPKSRMICYVKNVKNHATFEEGFWPKFYARGKVLRKCQLLPLIRLTFLLVSSMIYKILISVLWLPTVINFIKSGLFPVTTDITAS